jgi:hypothetical protein
MSAAATEVTEFLGITSEDCPVDCRMGHCVITGDGHCGHPKKGGIQAPHKMMPAVLERYRRARKHLAIEDTRRRSYEQGL